ncbi:MAG: ATP-binding protein, partial [Paludibacter sp.]|nr:ATP-binding protein [Paludibacter sp.]
IFINAEQAITGEGKIEIGTSIDDKGYINLSIKDSGCGIDESHIPHVTDPFFTTKEPGTGSGLGLSISYTILKSHGGELSIQSKKNEGTTVQITLPQAIW